MSGGVLDRARRYFTGLFFDPDTEDRGTPDLLGLSYEEVRFPSGNNTLHGYFLRGGDKGTILHCHGNAGNVTAHVPLVAFLARAGYDVLTFDYAGFGRSTGARPSLEGIEEDARAALAFLLASPNIDATRLAVFGQSLGGAAAAAAAVHPAVRCLVLEATFTTYRSMARATTIGRALLPLVPFVIPRGGAAEHLRHFAPRPVLLLHGDADRVVPSRFSRRLHAGAPSHTRLVIVEHLDHLELESPEAPALARAALEFLDEHLAPRP